MHLTEWGRIRIIEEVLNKVQSIHFNIFSCIVMRSDDWEKASGFYIHMANVGQEMMLDKNI